MQWASACGCVWVCFCFHNGKKGENPISTQRWHAFPLVAAIVHCENIFKMYFVQPCVAFMFIFIPFGNAENCSYMHKYSANSSVNAHTLWTMANGFGWMSVSTLLYPDSKKYTHSMIWSVCQKNNTVGSQWTRWKIWNNGVYENRRNAKGRGTRNFCNVFITLRMYSTSTCIFQKAACVAHPLFALSSNILGAYVCFTSRNQIF